MTDKELAIIALQAYSDIPGAAMITGQHTDTECFIITRPDCYIVAFRGSEHYKTPDGVKDWLYNFWCGKTGLFHTGFYLKVLSVIDDIQMHTPDGSKTLYITGHSLGAACAVVASYLLRKRSPITRAIGPPRSASWLGALAYLRGILDTKCYMIKGDWITKLPPWFFGFAHVGEKVVLESEGKGIDRLHDPQEYIKLIK